MTETRKVKLSLDKFINLLKRHDYTLVAVYCDKQNIKFVECRTPRQQKTFVVYLPEKYTMIYPKSEYASLKRLDVASTNAPPSSRQIEFMSNMKGPLLECDLVAISSETLCMYKNNNSAECFDIVDTESSDGDENEDKPLEEEKLDEISVLEKDTLNVLKKVKGPKAKLPKASLRQPKANAPEPKAPKTEHLKSKSSEQKAPEPKAEPKSKKVPEPKAPETKASPPKTTEPKTDDVIEEEEEIFTFDEDEEEFDTKEEIIIPTITTPEAKKSEPVEPEVKKTEPTEPAPKKSETVELVFEDDDGEPFDEVKTMLNTTTATKAESSLRDIRAKVNERDAETDDSEAEYDSEDEESHTTDNALPPELEEGELILGIIYVMIDIGGFFRKITMFEDDVIKCYEQLDENELEMRSNRLSKIREMTMTFLKHSEERLNEISREEKELKVQLIRLTVVLAQSLALKSRIEIKPEKYGEIVGESDRIHQHTRSAIHELNMELLKLRDSADELLIDYRSSIEELMNM